MRNEVGGVDYDASFQTFFFFFFLLLLLLFAGRRRTRSIDCRATHRCIEWCRKFLRQPSRSMMTRTKIPTRTWPSASCPNGFPIPTP